MEVHFAPILDAILVLGFLFVIAWVGRKGVKVTVVEDDDPQPPVD